MVGWTAEMGKESSPAMDGIIASYYYNFPEVEPRFVVK
jgi:hypothetical protein